MKKQVNSWVCCRERGRCRTSACLEGRRQLGSPGSCPGAPEWARSTAVTVHPEAAIDRGDPARLFLVAGSCGRRGAREAQTGTAESRKGRFTPRSTCYPRTGEPNGAWPGQESRPSGCEGHGEHKPPRGHGLGRTARPGGAQAVKVEPGKESEPLDNVGVCSKPESDVQGRKDGDRSSSSGVLTDQRP